MGNKVSTEEALAAIDKLGCRYVVVCFNVGMANRIARERPLVTVVYRDWFPTGEGGGDGDLHTKVTAQQWIDHMWGLGLDARILWYCVNEPTKDWRGLTAFLLAAMILADKIGRTLVVGNFSTGVPEPEDWEDMLALGLLLWHLDNSQHALGIHEYIYGTLAESGSYVGRFIKALTSAAEKGHGNITVLVTEFGFDLKGSWNKLRYSAEYVADATLEAFERFYKLFGISVCWFSFGQWMNDPNIGEFDMRAAVPAIAARVGRLLTRYVEASPNMNTATLTVTAGSLNIRDWTSTVATKGKVFLTGEYHGYSDGKEVIAGDYVWVAWEDAERRGWVALRSLDNKYKFASIKMDAASPPPEEDELEMLRRKNAELKRENQMLSDQVVSKATELMEVTAQRDTALAQNLPQRQALELIADIAREGIYGPWTTDKEVGKDGQGG